MDMKNMKCYGRKKVVIPKEKSFIKKFFDGNESSDIFADNMSFDSEDKGQNSNANECQGNRHHIFDSPNLFNEVLSLKPKKYGLRSVAEPKYEDRRSHCNENKENIEVNLTSPVLFKDEFSFEQEKNDDLKKVVKPKQVAKNKKYNGMAGKKYGRKKVKGIQHLSTKYCKSLQPCWEEFEKHDLNIERPNKVNNPDIIEQQQNNFKVLKDIKQYVKSLPSTSTAKNVKVSKGTELPSEACISPKRKKTSAFYLPSNETLEGSGELFTEDPKYKTCLKKKNFAKKKKKFRTKHSDKFSHNLVTEMEEKINQCMQNVDLSNTCNKSINARVSNYQENIYPRDSALQNTIPIQNSTASPFVEIIPINKDFGNTTSKVSKNHETVSADTLAISSKNKFSISLRCNNKINNFENSQHPHQKLGNLFEHCYDFNGNSYKDNYLTSKSANLCKDNMLIQNISKCETLHESYHKTNSDELQAIMYEEATIEKLESTVSCRSTSDKVSVKQIHISQKEPNHIQSKLVPKMNTKDHNISHELQTTEKDHDISMTNNANSPHPDEKNSSCKTYRSKIHPLSPNISCIIQACKNSYGLISKGKFTTSTPVTRSKFHHNINAEIIGLSNDENTPKSKACSKQCASFCEKVTENKSTKPIITERPLTSFINCSKASAAVEILNSMQCPNSDMHKSRTSISLPTKSVIHLESLRKTQSSLNLSSIHASDEREKPVDFSKDKLLKLCDQDSVTPFPDIYDWKNFKVKKIGEGTYGEVFMLSKGKITSVLKVIPVSEDPNVKNLQGLSSVYSEIKISKSLSELRSNKTNHSKNFVKVKRSSVVSGSYPAVLMKAWDDFSKDRSTYNDRPDIYAEDQLFVILELEYGGNDMSCFALRNAVEAEIILKQVAVSLAVAEEEFSFEHRDLHLGNILVKRSRSKTMSYKIRGKDVSFPCLGLQVTLIDFTLSLLLDKGYIYYYDLAEDSLFDQTGDYQFDVYKSMRRHLENKWEECSLYSNVLWLKYLCKKMKESKYTHPTAVTHKRGLKAIDTFNVQLMKCSCALESLEKCGITQTVFKRSMSDTPRRSVLVSRSSIQKSKLSVCN